MTNKINDNFKKYLPLNRKERFYTGTILPQIICYDNFKYFSRFTELINGFPENLKFNPDADSNNIIFMTEYSLNESYKNLNDRKLFVEVPKTKETPDIVILITEPEKILVVVEAKMYNSENYSKFRNQFNEQKKIVSCIKNNLGIIEKNIFHFALVPQKYFSTTHQDEFQILFWEDILNSYKDILEENYFYNVLKFAIDNYDNLKSTSTAFSSFGKNMDNRLTGLEIINLHNSGKRFCVGRSQGINGDIFRTDVYSGGWKFFKYEIKYTDIPPNRNWFTSSHFADEVIKNYKENSDNSEKQNEMNSDWHFSHLGEGYFKNIAYISAKKYSLDVPIKTVFIGKTGEPYTLIKFGRYINPNWCVILENGEEKKYNTTSKKLSEGLWGLSNCFRFEWDEIKRYFERSDK